MSNPPARYLIRSFLLLLMVCILGPQSLFAQNDYSPGYFRSPFDFPLALSGSYAEVRTNHFHSGIDIRTGGVTGKPVYAVAEGYVSRIYVSPWGFGKAVYIHHPSGHTSVYAHLDRFNDQISAYVKKKQYASESFSLNEYLGAGTIQVRKGEIIGYSGNSGNSGGPHLHFEIRDLKTQEPMDPVDFGIPVSDHLAPQIRWIRIYPYNARASVDYGRQPKSLKVKGGEGIYRLESPDTVRVSGEIYFGIETYDYHEVSNIRCGVKSIDLYVDGIQVFGQRVDRYSFSKTRYVNALLDYAENQRNKQRFQRSYIAPGNDLDIYHNVINRGIIHFFDEEVHAIRYVVKDARSNTSEISFVVRSFPTSSESNSMEPEYAGTLFHWDQPNRFSEEGVLLDLPPGTLYEDFCFIYSVESSGEGFYSPVHHIHSDDTPLHDYAGLMIRPENLPDGLRKKAVIVSVENGKIGSSKGGEWQNGLIKARIRDFGSYAIAVDTLEPRIKPLNIYNGKHVDRQKTIAFKISDDLSGIQYYKGTINGSWILMDYDGKTGNLVYEIDSRMPRGKSTFNLTVRDEVGNSQSYQATLVR